ncbi:MAG: IPT/TIG domain-containing protein [Candidatus Sericytochromatia bacterium]
MKKIYGVCLTLALAACQTLPTTVGGPQGLISAPITQPTSLPLNTLPRKGTKKILPSLTGLLDIQPVKNQMATIQMRLQVPRKLFQNFRTQGSPTPEDSGTGTETAFASFAYLRVSLKAPPQADPIYPLNALREPDQPERDYLIENTGEPLTIVFENIPAGALRFASITAFDSDKRPIPGSTIEAVFPVGTESTPVSREVTFRTTPLAQVLTRLLLSAPDLAKAVDLSALQQWLDQLTGLQGARPNYLYTLLHPLQIDVALLAADLLAVGGDLARLDAQKNYALPVGRVVGVVQGLATGDHLLIQTSDLSQPVLEVTANGPFDLEGLRPGIWTLVYWVEGGTDYQTPGPRQVLLSGGQNLDLGLISLEAQRPVIGELSASERYIGQTLLIQGSGFHTTLAGNQVWIGEQLAEVLNASEGDLEVRVPAGPVGPQTVKVQVGTASTNYTGFTRMGIDTVSPSTGRIGDWMTLTGLGLENVFRVHLNGTEASFNVLSGTEIQVQIPAGASTGKVELFVGEGEGFEAPGSFNVSNKVLFVAAQNMRVAALNESGNGLSWDTAFVSLQSALAAAASGDEIWVAEGLYTPTEAEGNRALAFQLKNDVALYGGFARGERNRQERDFSQNLTVLSGDLNDNDQQEGNARSDNSYHVVRAASGLSATAVLDGFTIQAGQADAPGLDMRGGGIFSENASPTLRNLVLRDNHAYRSGGGMEISISGSPLLENIVFENNSAANADSLAAYGGGLQIETYASSAPVLKNIVFLNNYALSDGGALFVLGAQPRLTQGTFVGNRTGNPNAGNAIGTSNTASRLELFNSVFWNNPGRDLSIAGGQLQVAYNALEEGLGGIQTYPVTGSSYQDLGGNLSLGQNPFGDLNFVLGNDQRWMTLDDGLRPYPSSPLSGQGNPALASTQDISGQPRLPAEGVSIGAYEPWAVIVSPPPPA